MTDLAAIKAELRTLLEKATPGPWKVAIDVFESDPPYYFSVLVEGERSEPGATLAPFFVSETNVLNEVTQESSQRALDSQEGRDAALIVAAVNALPALLADTPSVEPAGQPDMRDWDVERELAYRLGTTLTEAALAGITLDVRDRAALHRILAINRRGCIHDAG